MDERRAFVDRALERLATEDESLATRALVDDRGAHGTREVVVALGLAAGVDQPDATGVAVDDLPAREIDRVVGRQLRSRPRGSVFPNFTAL